MPFVASAVWVISGIPAYLLAPYPTDTDEHTAFVRSAMALSAPICSLAYLVYWLIRRALAERRSKKHQVQLFQLGTVAAAGKERESDNSTAQRSSDSANHKRRIFLMHGHDAFHIHKVSRFLERLDEVVVLRELPSGGRIIIEKFMELSEVDFAVALLAPDDRGGLASEKFEQQRLRARQNVMLVLGRLGRDRVCVLYRSGIEIPSDYGGILFVELDDKGAWKLPLAGEIREVGLSIDLGLVFVDKR